MKKLTLFLGLALILAISCKKKSPAPADPVPATTGGTTGNPPPATTKTIGISIMSNAAGTSTLYPCWEYDTGTFNQWNPTPLFFNNSISTFTNAVPLVADSMYFACALNANNFSYTVSVNGSIVKAVTQTTLISAYIKY